MEINDQRRRQLIELLKETYDLIGQLEGRGLYVTDPLERRRLQKEAADLKSRADEWNAELTRLENPAVTVSPITHLPNEAQIEKEQTELNELRQELRAAPGPGVGIVSPVGEARRLRVFLCHSRGDKAAVRELYGRLLADGLQPWLDEEDLLPGQRWQVEIPKAVRASDVVLVCLSPGSINHAGYVNKEISYALDVALEQPEDVIYVIPVCLIECIVPDRLADFQWVNLFEAGGYERLKRALQFRAKGLGLKIKLPPSTVFAPIDDADDLADTNRYSRPNWQADYKKLRQAVSKLPNDQQQVIYLRYVKEYSDSEIARLMGKSEVTVRGILFRAHELLRKFPMTNPDPLPSPFSTPPDKPSVSAALDHDNRIAVWLAELEEAESKKDWDRTIEIGQIILKLESGHELVRNKVAQAYKERGNACIDHKHYKQAIIDYSRAIELNPTYAFAYNNRGVVYNYLEQYDHAISDYNHAIMFNPNYVYALSNRGSVYSDRRQYEQAIKDYNRAIELDRYNAPSYCNRGSVYHDLKQYDRAIQDYSRAIELDPSLIQTYNNRASVYDKLGDTWAAFQDRQQLQQLLKNPKSQGRGS